MTPAPGVRFGVYEILDRLGAGGMGEVYRAIDTKLNRVVALKFLPELFASDPDRLARFKREAQLLASLNDPNIASIYGFEDSDGVHALVLELVEGPTLADRVARGPIPLDEALPIAEQIARALEAAHEFGIVHRDLKPANIKVRIDGTVKVLDFGLAKALAPDGATRDASLTQSPTITSPIATRLGVILGTAAYMSPEQARGKTVDKRCDIWSFGCVLYEMLTGKPVFEGSDVADVLANVLKSDPDWSALPAETPSAIRRVLQRCLAKDPRRRLRDIADARLDLEERTGPQASPHGAAGSTLNNRERLVWMLVAVSLAGAFAYTWRKEPPSPPLMTEFQVGPPENTFLGSSVGGVAGAAGASSGNVSPDGTRLVFIATETSGKSFLWLRPLNSFVARPLTGTDGASLPFWSPNSRSIGFFVAGKLKKMDAGGGPAQTICDVPGLPRGATWAHDVVLFSSGNPPGLSRVAADGGTPVPVATPGEARETWPSWPYFLPDGRHFLYWVKGSSGADRAVSVGSIEPGFESRRLVASDTNAVYASPGFLLFARERTLLRQRFDAERLELSGEATPVAEQVLVSPEYGLGAFSTSATDVLTFRSGANVSTQFAWFDRAGRLLEPVGSPGNYRTVGLSPDEKRLVFVDVNQSDIWIQDLSRQTRSRLTFNPGAGSPVWSPDGTKIVYRSTQDGGSVFEKNASGGSEQLILKAGINGPSQISPDGKFLLYFATPAGQQVQDVFVMPLTGDRTPIPIVSTPFVEGEPQFSPDGRWLAYYSNETGRNEVFVQPFPTTGAKWQISNSGGRQPLWRSDGKELFFVSDDRKFYAVDLSSGSAFDYRAPHFLFDMRADVFNAGKSYAPSRDGQRFLVNMLLDNASSPINIVLNWTAGLSK